MAHIHSEPCRRNQRADPEFLSFGPFQFRVGLFQFEKAIQSLFNIFNAPRADAATFAQGRAGTHKGPRRVDFLFEIRSVRTARPSTSANGATGPSPTGNAGGAGHPERTHVQCGFNACTEGAQAHQQPDRCGYLFGPDDRAYDVFVQIPDQFQHPGAAFRGNAQPMLSKQIGGAFQTSRKIIENIGSRGCFHALHFPARHPPRERKAVPVALLPHDQFHRFGRPARWARGPTPGAGSDGPPAREAPGTGRPRRSCRSMTATSARWRARNDPVR